VPHAVAASLEPLDGNERFPDLGERSAALTQLLLGMLGKVHSHDGG
jgi:hypothetical protein